MGLASLKIIARMTRDDPNEKRAVETSILERNYPIFMVQWDLLGWFNMI